MEAYILLVSGLAIALVSIFGKSTKAGLKTTGVKTEGVVFDFNANPNEFSDSAITFDDPDRARVRFVTKKQEWITADIHSASGFSISKNYKSGQKIVVYYDPDNPKYFYIDSGISELTFKLIFFAVGLTLITVGLFELMNKQ